MVKIIDTEKLEKILDNEENEILMNMNYKKISKIKKQIIQSLPIIQDEKHTILKKLKDYRYINELPELQYGRYIRWISLKDPENIFLTNGGIICEIKVEDTGIHIVCKNRMNYLFQLNMSEHFIFQKLTNQEKILLTALQYVDS